MTRQADNLEIAESIGAAVELVLREFLANSPDDPEFHRAVRLAFLFGGLRSLILAESEYHALSYVAEGFKSMTGQNMVDALWEMWGGGGSAAKSKRKVH